MLASGGGQGTHGLVSRAENQREAVTRPAEDESGNYDGTTSEAVVTAQLMSGTAPVTSGTEHYTVSWSILAAGSSSIYLDAASNTVQPPSTYTICTNATQADPQGRVSCLLTWEL